MCFCGDCVWEAGAPFELRFGTKWVQCIVHAVDEARRVVYMALKVPNIGSAPMWLPFMRSVCGHEASTHLTSPHLILAPPLPCHPTSPLSHVHTTHFAHPTPPRPPHPTSPHPTSPHPTPPVSHMRTTSVPNHASTTAGKSI